VKFQPKNSKSVKGDHLFLIFGAIGRNGFKLNREVCEDGCFGVLYAQVGHKEKYALHLQSEGI
jgi:hypothetical protein